jgi:hypothetical protein
MNYDLSSLGRSSCSVIWSPTEKETVGLTYPSNMRFGLQGHLPG